MGSWFPTLFSGLRTLSLIILIWPVESPSDRLWRPLSHQRSFSSPSFAASVYFHCLSPALSRFSWFLLVETVFRTQIRSQHVLPAFGMFRLSGPLRAGEKRACVRTCLYVCMCVVCVRARAVCVCVHVHQRVHSSSPRSVSVIPSPSSVNPGSGSLVTSLSLLLCTPAGVDAVCTHLGL